jgi:signal transduction histidine kinase
MSVPRDSSSIKGPPARRDAWERWINIWHGVFYLTLLIPTVFALLAPERIYPKWLVLVFSLALGAWYGLIIVWLLPRVEERWQTSIALVFLIVAVVLWFPLASTHGAYLLTASSFYGLMWGILPFWMAVAGNVIFTGFLIGFLLWIQAQYLGTPIDLPLDMLVTAIVVLAWAILLALWMRSVMKESKERKKLIKQLEAAQENLAAVERQAGILQERQRLAQEIHDTLAQGFTSIVMQLEAADQVLSQEEIHVRRHLGKASDTARESLAEARRLVQALQPESLEGASLPEVIRREAAAWGRETEVQTIYTLTGEPIALTPEYEVTLLRATQEALMNVRKHAQATQVSVTLSYMDDQVALDIQDDGVGFDPQLPILPAGQYGGGFGLQVMRQRVEQLGGEVILESSPRGGTTLVVQVPIIPHASQTDLGEIDETYKDTSSGDGDGVIQSAERAE